MGVKGFYRVLQEEGWLPDDAGSPCCSTSLWRDASVMHNCPAFASKVSLIKKRSTLFIDGAGLAFHLHRIAYARHAEKVLRQGPKSTATTSSRTSDTLTTEGNNSSVRRPSRRRSSTVKCACSAKHLTPDQVTKLLPNLLPLTLLEEVTRDFVDVLKKKHNMKLVVYFDGGKRREAKKETDEKIGQRRPVEWSAKKETDEKRGERRPVEWSAFQQYCCHGIMPSVDRVCQWEDKFPKNRLFITQVKHTLQIMQVEMVLCEEEADAELARKASTTPNAYVVGNDTDFCFFPKARYIPLKTLHADSSMVTGSVVTRKELAESLHMPNEEAMVELAILLGNDYVGSFPGDKFDFVRNGRHTSSADIMEHLRSEGEGYRVKSASGEETEKAIRFARMFYGLENLDEEFPLAEPSTEQHPGLIPDVPDKYAELAMIMPQHFPIELCLVQPRDTSLKGSIVRGLRSYVNQQQQQANGNNIDDTGNERGSDNGPKVIFKAIHLNALKQMSSARFEDSESVPWKPNWEDAPACHLIESCIAYTFRRNAESPLVRLSPPGKLFDCYLFHRTLYSLRNNKSSDLSRAKKRSESISKKTDKSMSPRRKESITEAFPPRVVLPIDEHEDRIIEHINNNRVTIIQGETGCGKSTRVPIMVLEKATPDPALSEVRLFISQPRRIAAKSLVERLRSTEPELGKTVALKMGHGVREYESSATRAIFCTTGYLVRVLANHPEKFNNISHLIIDEIHERSVDTDILCLLCRRLLETNTHIRLVLMSATLAAQLYQDYFGIAEPPIKVGVRRFPIEEIFVEELPKKLRLPPKELKAARQIENECIKTKCVAAPSNNMMENLYYLAARVAISVGQPGSSVLIFVPGMRDIEGISEIIEKTYCAGLTFTCVPIHSDIPFEDQMTVFDILENEVKIIIATNAAESSLTIPDCDHVICLGLQKQITYNASSHRQMLSPCWISRASARQRSGRVGRVRPGTVYRLYTREAYETMMKEFESGEMLRMPLDSVILSLKEILTEATTQALLDCLEPPDLSTIERSYESLYKSNFITQPDDDGDITTLGAFVSALGIDLTLGALIGLGIQFGVGPEAIELAAVLSFPKSPWIMSNALVHKPKSFNSGSSKTYASKNHFDAFIFSEPMATMNLIHEYNQLHGSRQTHFCQYHGVHTQRIRRLISTRNNLVARVADFKKLDPSLLSVRVPPSSLHHTKLTILRIIQVWVSSEIIEYKPLSHIQAKSAGPFAVPIKTVGGGGDVEEAHLDSLFRKNHSYSLKTRSEVEQTGGVVPVDDSPYDFFGGFAGRLASYGVDKELDLWWFWFENGLQLYASSAFSKTRHFYGLRKLFGDFSDESVLHLIAGKRRGRGERPSGRWTIVPDPSEMSGEESKSSVTIKMYTLRDANLAEGINNMIRNRLKKSGSAAKAMSFDFSQNLKKHKKKKGNNIVFQIFSCGGEVKKLNETDLCDLLAVPKRREHYRLSRKSEYRKQSIVFDYGNKRTDAGRNGEAKEEQLSIKYPLLQNAPEGARLLAILAAARRREATVHVPLPMDDEDSDASDDDELICFALDHGLGRMNHRWVRLDTDRAVFVGENSVPASVIPIDCQGALYACCANTLDLRGGSLRADGLTLLPPGTHFLLLAMLAFDLPPDELGSVPDDDEELDLFIANALFWAESKDSDFTNHRSQETEQSEETIDWSSRMKMSIELARSCADLGEQLVCYPEKIEMLCAVFDGVDGHPTEVWPNLKSDPFIPRPEHENRFVESLLAEMRHPSSFYEGYNSEKAEEYVFDASDPRLQDESRSSANEQSKSGLVQPLALDVSIREDVAQEEKESKEGDDCQALRGEVVDVFSEALLSKSMEILSASVPTRNVSLNDMPTTNILALVVNQVYNGLLYEAAMQPSTREQLLSAAERFRSVQLKRRDHWIVRRFVDREGETWYQALSTDSLIPMKFRPVRESPKWARYGRPWVLDQAKGCVPPQYRNFVCKQAEIYDADDTKIKALLFETIEIALRMEAAFVLERCFFTTRRHWYDQTFHDLMQELSKRMLPTSEILAQDTNTSSSTK